MSSYSVRPKAPKTSNPTTGTFGANPIESSAPLRSFSGRTNHKGNLPLDKGRCPVPSRINLQHTHQLHQQLIASAARNPAGYQKVSRHAVEVLAEHGTKFEGDKTMAFALSALCLDQHSMGVLKAVGETLHEIVETALDWVFSSPNRIATHFADHQRILPYLRKTRGQTGWQAVSRYDAVILADGGVRIMELNTGCPAGFLHSEDFSQVTQEAMHALKVSSGEVGQGLGLKAGHFGAIPAPALTESLLAIETLAKIPQGLIGLVNDENNLQNELELIAQAFARQGRQAEIMNAADIRHENNQAVWKHKPVSLLYNKIRISTANSPKHHWRPGFETRYAGFLNAIQTDSAVAVNNLAALTIAEDKGLLEVFRLSEFQSELTPAQQAFIQEHVLWTARLTDRSVDWHTKTIDLLPFVRANREKFVIKPANEGRGFGVVVGKYATDAEWEAACQIDSDLPCVVQDFAEPAQLPVLRTQKLQHVQALNHHLTLGLAMLQNTFRGVLSRISANPVTNVGREGIVQAVFLSE